MYKSRLLAQKSGGMGKTRRASQAIQVQGEVKHSISKLFPTSAATKAIPGTMPLAYEPFSIH